jgi:hypothetical protein
LQIEERASGAVRLGSESCYFGDSCSGFPPALDLKELPQGDYLSVQRIVRRNLDEADLTG